MFSKIVKHNYHFPSLNLFPYIYVSIFSRYFSLRNLSAAKKTISTNYLAYINIIELFNLSLGSLHLIISNRHIFWKFNTEKHLFVLKGIPHFTSSNMEIFHRIYDICWYLFCILLNSHWFILPILHMCFSFSKLLMP